MERLKEGAGVTNPPSHFAAMRGDNNLNTDDCVVS
jgi:hypothetical protein